MLRFTLEEGLQGMDLKHVLSEKDKVSLTEQCSNCKLYLHLL